MPNKTDENVMNTTRSMSEPSALKRFGIYLLDLPGNLLKAPFEALSDFFENHKRAISIAFWVALGVVVAFAIAGAVMASFFPGTWAAIAGVSVFGYSIAGLAGANLIAQVSLAAALVFAAVDVVLTPMFLVGSMIKNWCWPTENQEETVIKTTNPFDGMKETLYARNTNVTANKPSKEQSLTDSAFYGSVYENKSKTTSNDSQPTDSNSHSNQI